MQHTCADCDHVFTSEGQNEPHITPAVQCPQCHSYRTQPSGIPDEQNDMVHGIGAMPTSTQDDMSGNPLKEGILGDWQNRDKRDESFAASVKRGDYSLFEMPEFETTQIVAPPDLYRHGLESEATHRTAVQLPHGITDNLHAALGNLGAWVENPYEDGELRPYYNKYWKSIRPRFMKPGALQIGVSDPTMAEIINHVAQTDDLTPLYEYRGKTASTRMAGPLAALAPEALAGLGAGGADAGIAAGLAGGGDAAASAGASEAGGSAAGVGGLMQKVAPGLNYVDDILGTGANQGPGGGGLGGGGGGAGAVGGPVANDMSYYASDEDDAHPEAHDEIPQQEDGDYHQQDDGNHHEWQRDISVNDVGGTTHSPSFDAGGPGVQRLMMLAPLLLQMLDAGQDGSEDPLVKGLHDALEGEMPGYLNHADPDAAEQLILMLRPQKASEPTPEKNEPDHTDENSGGARESKVAALDGEPAEFLPDFTVTLPSLNGIVASPILLENIARLREGLPEDVQLKIDQLLRYEGPNATLRFLQEQQPSQQPSQEQPFPFWDSINSDQTPLIARTADTQGPHTPEQIQAVQKWLLEHGHEMGLEGDELQETVLSVPTNPLEFADILAQIQQVEPPPIGPDDAGMSPTPPMPAQENAPPGATMPVPGMEQQMMSAVQRYAADSVARACPECGSHTTGLLDEDGSSFCHACHAHFKTNDKVPNKIDSPTASTWNVDQDLRKEADSDGLPSATDDPAPVQGVPIADQQHQRNLREEQDSGHTWTDEEGNPLKVGQEYEMYSEKYDIPDLVRIEAVKPSSIVYTLTGEFGLEHSTELTKEEANIESTSFVPNIHEGELGGDDFSLEENNDDNTGYSGEPERTDASAPTGLVAASVVDSGVQHEIPGLAWLMEGVPHTAGANYTPMEQRALIDERGSARNADLLDLANTHYIQDAEEDQFLFGF